MRAKQLLRAQQLAELGVALLALLALLAPRDVERMLPALQEQSPCVIFTFLGFLQLPKAWLGLGLFGLIEEAFSDIGYGDSSVLYTV